MPFYSLCHVKFLNIQIINSIINSPTHKIIAIKKFFIYLLFLFLLFWVIICIIAACGDILIFHKTIKQKRDSWIFDHPAEAGFFIYKNRY
jgi:hypothetical protein